MDKYFVYFFLGKAPSEEQKISQWAQWEQCFKVFDPLLLPYSKSARIESDQVFVVPLVKPRGNVTFKKVPKLAALRWTYEDNLRWSDYSRTHTEPYKVDHLDTTIVSSKGQEHPDICIFIDDHFPASMTEYLHNQNLTVSVHERIHTDLPTAYWESMVATISTAINAVRVGRANRPWSIEKMGKAPFGNESRLYKSDLSWPTFAPPVTKTIQFSEFFQTWEYLR